VQRAASAWARANRKLDSLPEVRLRSALQRRGLRFRKNLLVHVTGLSVRPDVVFSRAKIAVFVDGCFWHCCPDHGGHPTGNSAYWGAKLERNRSRDALVTEGLESCGWRVIRLWEHVTPEDAADIIVAEVAARLPAQRGREESLS
jgi:DNA mismatch endonuclease, patch repair protein